MAEQANHRRFLFHPRDRPAALRQPCRLPPLVDKNVTLAPYRRWPESDPKPIFEAPSLDELALDQSATSPAGLCVVLANPPFLSASTMPRNLARSPIVFVIVQETRDPRLQ
jgi:hypothetical protein